MATIRLEIKGFEDQRLTCTGYKAAWSFANGPPGLTCRPGLSRKYRALNRWKKGWRAKDN